MNMISRRFKEWEDKEIERVIQVVREDALSCGDSELSDFELGWIVSRLLSEYFYNRHRRETRKLMRPITPSPLDNIKQADLQLIVERSVDHWVNMASSPSDDAQEDAKMF